MGLTPKSAPSSAALTPLMVVRTTALTIIAVCLVLPLIDVVTGLAPSLSRWLLLGACAVAALEAHYSFYLIRNQFISGPEALRFRLVEFGVYFVAVKLGQIALKGFPPEAAGLWLGDVRALVSLLIDLETILALVVAVGTATVVSDVLNDLERVGEPPELNKHYVSPLDSLTGRFFAGGAWILAVSGFSQVGLTNIFDLDRPPVTGLVANVLVYFLLGFVLLGQVRYALLTTRWQEQGVRVPGELRGRWVRYSMLFMGLAALVAFALPTGYTAGALGLLSNVFLVILGVLWALVAVLASICLLPVGLMLRLLNGGEPIVNPMEFLPPPPTPPLETQALPPWVEVLRTVIVWTLVVGMILYVVIQFLRDRPDLTRGLRQLALARRLRQLWAALRHRVSELAAAVRLSPVAAWLREQLARRAPLAPMRYFRLGGASPREQVMFYYLSLLRRAQERGFGRRPPQTPREYEPVLEARLLEAAPEVQALTEAFEETRYSAHPVGPEAVRRAREAWGKIRAALRKEKPKE